MDPATSRCPNLEYLTLSQFFSGNMILVVFIPSENMLKIFIPYLKPTATLKVRGWASRVVGWSLELKRTYQASIFSKLIDETCSYFTALTFLSADRIKINFFVGSTEISRTGLIRRRELRIFWTGDRSVSTSVSYNSKLKTTGNIFPGGSEWFWTFCFTIFD